jgi:ubiquinone/menaquinone biosynthesis C-methylase UbiE
MDNTGILYDRIGTGYNTTRRADPYITERLFHRLSPEKGHLFLDIGCGTGNYTIALANKGLNFYGVEPSVEMLDVARSRSSKVTWLIGTAEQIPVEDNTFAGVMATLTIHHWKDIKKAFTEINRALKADGKIIIFTALPTQMQGYWLNHYFPKMMANSIAQMPGFDLIENAATVSGFTITATEKYFIQPDLHDYFLYSGKHAPELYLDENIRKGISSFAAFGNLEEVEKGLVKLADDIKTNTFAAIKKQYDNDLGDYLFITLKKD